MGRVAAGQAFSDAELYRRGSETLTASWERHAAGAKGARLHRRNGVAAAAFPEEPERAVYNNALIDRDLAALERAAAIDTMESAYAAAGVSLFAAWVHETDTALRTDLERRGYTIDTSTRAMGMVLDDIRLPRAEIDLAVPDLFEHLRLAGMPPGFLSTIDADAFHVLIARLGEENIATAIAFDLDGDCGIYNVGTLERARRRGLGTALTILAVRDARARGCQTASLQSTVIAERVYAAAGFRDLGLIVEYTAAGART